jgi:hypothetical protein
MFGPVPVMDIPVDDGDPFNGIQGMGSSDRGIIEEAEPHGPVMLGMMTGWPDEGKCMPAIEAAVHGHDRGTGSIQGSRKRAAAHVRIGVDEPGRFRSSRTLPQPRRVIRRMYPVHGFIRRRLRGPAGNRRRDVLKYMQEAGFGLGMPGEIMAGTGKADDNAAGSHCSSVQEGYTIMDYVAGPGLSALSYRIGVRDADV